jgi:hypothetical protein
MLVACLFLAVSGPQQPQARAASQGARHGLLFAGWQGGRVFSSADGHAWREADAGLPPGADITAIAAMPGVIYAGTDGVGVYSSLDSGRHWRESNGGSAVLRGAQVRGLAVDPRYGRAVFVATAGGDIFHSLEGGRHRSSIPTRCWPVPPTMA